MKKLFFIISLFISASIFAQNPYPIISPYPNPMFKQNVRVTDSTYVGDIIGIGITRTAQAAFHLKTKNISGSDTSILIEGSDGQDRFWIQNNGIPVMRPVNDVRYVFNGNELAFTNDAGAIRTQILSAGSITWNFTHWNSSNIGIGFSNPIAIWDLDYLVNNGTAIPGSLNSDAIGIYAHPTYSSTTLDGAKFLYHNPTVSSLLGTHYFIYSTAGRVFLQNTTEQLRLGYDGSNYLSETIAADGDVTLDGTGTDPEINLNEPVVMTNSDATEIALSINAHASQSQRIFEVVKGSDTFLKVGSTGKFDVSSNRHDANPVMFIANQDAAFTDLLLGMLTGSTHVLDINYQGRTTTYDSKTTANRGAAVSVGSPLHLTAQSATKALTTVYTTDADGWYRITVQGAVTTANAGSTLGPVTVKYNNVADAVDKTVSAGTVNNYNTTAGTSTSNAINVTYTVYAKTGTALQIACTYSDAGTIMRYSLDATVEQL